MPRSLTGELAEMWREVPLFDVCELRAGASTPADSGGPVRVVKPRNVTDGRLTGTPDGITEESAGKLGRYRLVAGDIVCVRTGGVGRHALATVEHTGWIFGTGIIRLRPGEDVDPLYLNHYLSHPSVQDWFRRNVAGTAVPSISTGTLGTLPVALPPMHTQKSIGRTLGTLNEKIAIHEQICRTTAELRDVLLSRLLSGEPAPPAEHTGDDGAFA
ncbi:restriction endonuclease subunit S [Planomonospora parontospora]|uniref:restriction endonuclease subunit S n=1 Tax=Planomonospora parontospora TaxID=58119 RepID=UPI00166FD630|nr:restriction endonuclease subunit S [Planomonospora parontospora]GGL36967.1 hypothetical protein GCM10014719_42730 [Planomonospora parontospora subsp. antibiotica]GII17292.1 hypothetical protein Ppa05_40180 [Planomonospora parontospora subsp. antibiotica]